MSNMNEALWGYIIAQKQAEKYQVADPKQAATTGLLLGMTLQNPLFSFLLTDRLIQQMPAAVTTSPATGGTLPQYAGQISYTQSLGQRATLKILLTQAATTIEKTLATSNWRSVVEQIQQSEPQLSENFVPFFDATEFENLYNSLLEREVVSETQYSQELSMLVHLNNYLLRVHAAATAPVATKTRRRK
jgi:hypothetical protein